jgi:hypothetical protein
MNIQRNCLPTIPLTTVNARDFMMHEMSRVHLKCCLFLTDFFIIIPFFHFFNGFQCFLLFH